MLSTSLAPRLLARFAVAFAITSLASPSPAQSESAAGPLERSGAFYSLRYHGADAALAEAALAVVDQAWPIAAAAFGVPDAKPSQPLEIHLYRRTSDYRAADAKLTGGKFERNLAMAHWATRSAHVALQPPCSDETLRAVGLPAQTVALLAWEATHLARFELCRNFESHPDWVCDGLAASSAQRIYSKQFPGAVESAPFWSMDLLRARRLAEAGKLPPVESVLSDRIADLDLQDRYAVRDAFFAFLSSEARKPKLASVLATVRSTGGGPGFAAKVLEHAKKALGDQDKPFAKYVAAQKPQWEEIYRSLSTSGSQWVQIAFPERNAIAWRTEPVKAKRLSASGALRILPGGRQQLNFLFGRSEQGFYSIAFVADYGFTVFDYRADTNQWTNLGEGVAPALRLGVSTEFTLEAAGDKLALSIGEKSWKIQLPRELPPAIAWGIGAQAGPEGAETGSAGLWTDLSVGK
jgi:hypothetical protein